jgi:hypothetical protein
MGVRDEATSIAEGAKPWRDIAIVGDVISAVEER